MHIGIIGAGISGLSLGWFLKQKFKEHLTLTIFEKEGKPGGWIETVEMERFLFDLGPRSFRSKGRGEATLQLVETLGIQRQLIAASPAALVRYLYHQGELRKIPSNPLSFLFSPLMRGVIPALFREWFKAPGALEDETIYSFVSRRFSPAIADRLIDPLISGIFAGDIRELSIRSCFPQFYAYEQAEGSVLKGMLKRKPPTPASSPWIKAMQKSPLLSFRKGMQSLTDALALQLQEHLKLGQKVTSLQMMPDKIRLETNHAAWSELDYLYLAVPAPVVGELLQPFAAVPPIPSASIIMVNMGWHEKVLNKEGFGYLIPSKEGERLLGVVWDSSAFPEQNQSAIETRLTVMLGGTHHQDLLQLPRDRLIEIALDGLYKHLGIVAKPDAICIRVAHQAVPQYLLGHAQRSEAFMKEVSSRSSSRIKLIGNAWNGIGINDCIFNARAAANEHTV